MTNDQQQTLMQFHLRKRLALMSVEQARNRGQSISEPMAELEAACKESMSYAASIADESGAHRSPGSVAGVAIADGLVAKSKL